MKPETQKWVTLVNETCHKNGITYSESWSLCSRTHIAEHVAMMEAGKTKAEIANEASNGLYTTGLGGRMAAQQKFIALVWDYQAKYKVDYDTAWNHVKITDADLYKQTLPPAPSGLC